MAKHAQLAMKIMKERDSEDSKAKQYNGKALKLFLN
jgi:hypothetical protein